MYIYEGGTDEWAGEYKLPLFHTDIAHRNYHCPLNRKYFFCEFSYHLVGVYSWYHSGVCIRYQLLHFYLGVLGGYCRYQTFQC